jgi:hypothetical protein
MSKRLLHTESAASYQEEAYNWINEKLRSPIPSPTMYDTEIYEMQKLAGRDI